MQVWEHDRPAQLNFTGEDLSNAIEYGRLVDLSELMNSEKEGMTTTTKTKKKSSRKRPWLGAVIEDAPLVSLHIATNGIGLGCSTHDASNGRTRVESWHGKFALLSNLINGCWWYQSLFRSVQERMVNGLGVVGGVHSLHEIFGVSGTAPGSMYRMADGTYDAGKGNAGILRSLVGYWDECGKWASFCSSNAGGDCCWCYVHISRRQHK